MATVQLNAASYGYIDEANPNTHYNFSPSSWYRLGSAEKSKNEKRILMHFGAFPSSLKRKALTGMQLMCHLRGVSTDYVIDCTFFYSIFESAFDPGSVTWNTRPSSKAVGGIGKNFQGSVPAADYLLPSDVSYSDAASAAGLARGGCVMCRWTGILSADRDSIDFRANLSNNAAPYVIITYDENTTIVSKIEYRSGPQSGYYNPRNAVTFSWAFVKADKLLTAADETFQQASATFYWKKSTDSTYTAVQISGSAQNVTIPANTFPTASTIQWYVEGTDTDGTTTQTPVYSFSTAAGAASAIPVSPINTVEDGSNNIVFKWDLSSTDGQPASRVYAAWKLYENTSDPWTRLFDVSNSITQYSVPANTFPAGGIAWTICAFNVDGVQGAFREARFISVAAPQPVQGLSATSVPRPTITWQSSEQKAYEISIDGVVVKKAFSESVNSWTVGEPLDDGDHEISVRVQGQYGLWSQPSTITITVQNSPPWSATLSAEFGLDAILSVDIGNQTMTPRGIIHWYRDGVRIARVTYREASGPFGYTDRTALGEHSYYAELWHNNGNYSRTNVVTGIMGTRRLMIAPAAGGDWIDLGLSEKSTNQETFSMSTSPALYHVLGAKYPHADLSQFADLSGKYNCAFSDPLQAAQFEALFGSAVILKSRRDNVVTGILTPIQKEVKRFYVAYTFTVQQVHTDKMVIINENS